MFRVAGNPPVCDRSCTRDIPQAGSSWPKVRENSAIVESAGFPASHTLPQAVIARVDPVEAVIDGDGDSVPARATAPAAIISPFSRQQRLSPADRIAKDTDW
jgi:hypothetical protein